MDRDEAVGWLRMCGWDTLAAIGNTRAAPPIQTTTAACHVMQGFIDRCAELDHVYSDWRITSQCRECAAVNFTCVCMIVNTICKYDYIHVKLLSKVLHKIHIDFYVNVMQDF